MKKIIQKTLQISFITAISLSNISKASAGILSPIADTFLTIELSKSQLSHQGVNSNFENRQDFFENLKQFDDIALGGNIRFGKYLGFNVNWSKTSLKNDMVNGLNSLESKAKYKAEQINTTALLYLPIVSKRVELFAEGGVVDIGSKLNYTPSGGVKINNKSHQTMGLYGLGLQVSPLGNDFVRLSIQRYAGKIGLLDANYTTFRLGYLKSF